MLCPHLRKEGPFVVSLDEAKVGGEKGVGLLGDLGRKDITQPWQPQNPSEVSDILSLTYEFGSFGVGHRLLNLRFLGLHLAPTSCDVPFPQTISTMEHGSL